MSLTLTVRRLLADTFTGHGRLLYVAGNQALARLLAEAVQAKSSTPAVDAAE